MLLKSVNLSSLLIQRIFLFGKNLQITLVIKQIYELFYYLNKSAKI